jgi:3-oxoacyl-[acyl-carrier protein] reductase
VETVPLAPEILRDRVALVTGGSGGIGRALCARLAGVGAAVAVGYGSGQAPAEALVDAIAGRGGRAIAVGGDLAEPETPSALVEATERALGPVDVLVANAGTGSPLELQDVRLEDWNRVVDVNLRAPFLLAQRVAPGMRERRFGRILFVSSVAAFIGGIVGPHYAASKSGLHGLTRYLSSRLAGDGITVNAIAPALVEQTGMLPGGSELAAVVPVGRLGRPAEVADLALAMLANPYLTNQVVLLDGGIHPA